MPDFKRWLTAGFIVFAMTGCGSDSGGNPVAGPNGELRLAAETATTKPWTSETPEASTVSAVPIKSSDAVTSPASTAITVPQFDGSASILAQTAASLAPGQSRKVPTLLSGLTLVFGSEGANFVQWGDSGYYDPTRKEVGFIGKRDSTYPYHWLVYNESANTWSNSRLLWDAGDYYGHGYDHNTIDPATGTVYYRPYGSQTVRAWSGSWSALPNISQSITIVGGLTWFPGVGLMYNDGSRLLRYSGGAWSQVAYFGGDSYHDFSEYNSKAHVLIFGGGESSPLRKMTASLAVSTLASPPFTLGSSKGKSVTISDPNSPTIIAYQKGTTNWAKYDITTDTWSSLRQCSCDGSSPVSGTPNLAGDVEAYAIGISIPQYGVMMFIQYRGAGSTPADVWLYRYS